MTRLSQQYFPINPFLWICEASPKRVKMYIEIVFLPFLGIDKLMRYYLSLRFMLLCAFALTVSHASVADDGDLPDFFVFAYQRADSLKQLIGSQSHIEQRLMELYRTASISIWNMPFIAAPKN